MAEAEAPAFDPAPPAPATSSLDERERDVLAELAREIDARVSFQGLRRQLGVHQQALARTLRRLAEQGLVAHDGSGYQLTPQGAAAIRVAPGAITDDRAIVPVLQALLPPHVAPGDVERHLSRRWFGGLHWYGRSEAGGETSLHWIAGKERVTVRVAFGSLTMEVAGAEGGAEASPNAFLAARPVLAALAELYGLSAA